MKLDKKSFKQFYFQGFNNKHKMHIDPWSRSYFFFIKSSSIYCSEGPKTDDSRYSRCSLTSAASKGTIPALGLLATPFLVQARRLLALLASWATDGSHAAGCQPAPPAPFLPGNFPATCRKPVPLQGAKCSTQQLALLNAMQQDAAH